ncbi:MAG: ArsR family transcriptional regulator [Solirubrobacteraceae bacterium]
MQPAERRSCGNEERPPPAKDSPASSATHARPSFRRSPPPSATTDLARRLELTPSGVSQHLSALRDAGLVASARRGRAVLYIRTPLADQLLQASAP